ncbi:MAG: rhodanese-like domain-containing protein [Pseudomonadales bacterium]|jgi:rhodanese-related sulfurtransferase|nr:rhodanese-like domain-containing protein [Pseudomonadales bacterium]
MDRFLQYVANHPGLVGLAAVAALLVVVYELRERGSSAASVSPQELIRLQNQGALVLDIRKADAFEAGHVVGARHLPSDQIPAAGDTLKKHKEKPVIVYCDTGSLAAAAIRQLHAQGFTKAFNLRGGLAGWRTDNLPVAKGA